MRKRITCCNQCEQRHVGCHASCEDYKRQCEEVNEFKALVRADTDARKEIAEYHKHNSKRRRPPKPTADR